ncbi:IclR family transcriptional regulator C-terminal domain-containing protein [Streptomyces sp. M10(2022)]
MQTLATALQVTVHIGVIDGDRIVYADKAESFGTVRLYSEIGKSVRLHASGVGKAVLAWADDEDRERLLATCEFERFTPTTVVGRPRSRSTCGRSGSADSPWTTVSTRAS